MDLTAFADEVGTSDPVTITGLGSRGGPVDGVRAVRAPVGIVAVHAEDMTVRCGAGTSVAELRNVLRAAGQDVALPPGGTVGGALSVGRQGIRLLGDGPVRNCLLQAWFVDASGQVVMAGGPTVKNVSGFDLCRLLVGARGTLGFLGEVVLRTRPAPPDSCWFTAACEHPHRLTGRIRRATSVLWDGTSAWVLLEGHQDDIVAQARDAGLAPCEGPPAIDDRRSVIRAVDVAMLSGTFVAGVGTGVVYGDCSVPPLSVHPGARAVAERMKAAFDPAGRLNPGVDVG